VGEHVVATLRANLIAAMAEEPVDEGLVSAPSMFRSAGNCAF
jgi:hypothetical protein